MALYQWSGDYSQLHWPFWKITTSASIGRNAHNIDVIRANHKVNVRARNVDTMLQELLFGHIISILDALGKPTPSARWQLAFLVIERVIEQDVAFTDRRVLGNERDLSQVSSALVSIDDTCERCLPTRAS